MLQENIYKEREGRKGEREKERDMGILYEDVVMIKEPDQEGEATVITVNCPDKTGLGCDLSRLILFFRLSIIRADVSTDGKWCYIVFWVVGSPNTSWNLLKERMMEVCPSCSSASEILCYWSELEPPRPPNIFLLKFCCLDRRGLLHDVTVVLCELELTIKKVKVSTMPDGKVMDLFFITDTRELLHTKKRQEAVSDCLKAVIGDIMISCEIEMMGPEITACSLGPIFLPSSITKDTFSGELDEVNDGPCISTGLMLEKSTATNLSVTLDNSFSLSHTVVQIVCHDYKGLLYDIMRTLKDYDMQISYGRFHTKQERHCEIDLFIMQADGKKMVDPSKQSALCSRIRMELLRPLRVALVSRGPDTELLVANPVELSGKGRPLVFYDITLALKILNTGIFLAEVGRHMIRDREWEVYRVLIDEGESLSIPRNRIEEGVWKMLMGWN